MFTTHEVVSPSKVDEQGNLKLFSATQMMQDCSQLWLDSEPFAARFFRENNRAQLLVSRQIDIIRVPRYGEKLSITTSIFEFKELYGFRNTVIRDEAGHPCYVTWSMGAFISLETNKLAKLPQELTDSITIDEKYPMEYVDRKIRIPAGESTTFEEIHPRKDDIDFNHHINNAQYMRMAMEYLPEDFLPVRIRIEYKNPVRMGDVITPALQSIDGGYLFTLKNGTTLCCVIEFKNK